MKTLQNTFLGTSFHPAGLALALCVLSGTADAFQHNGAQTRPSQPPAWDIHFPEGVSMVEVPFREETGMIAVDVKVNGSGPFSFIIESGWSAPGLLITENPEAFDFDFKEGGGNGKHQMGRLAKNVRIEVGDLRIEGLNLEVASRSDSEFIGMLPEDGVLGVKLFANLVVEVDWENNLVRLHDPSSYEAPAGAVPVPLTFKRGLSYATGEVTIDGKAQPIKFVVDTGSAGTLFLRADKVGVPKHRISGIKLGQGVFGVVTGSIGRVDKFQLGGATLENIVARFLDGDSNIGAVGSDGNLGNGILNRFVVTFDYARSRMLLKPTDAIHDPFPFSTSGMSIDQKIGDDGSIGIRRIYDDAPAAKAGLKVGDRIVSLNAQPVADLGIDAIRDLLRESPGTRVTLEIQNAGSIREVVLILDTVI